MARGRFIDNKIVLSKQVSQLSDDTCRLLFTWMVTFADKEGRLFGDPALIRGTIFPRNEKITVKKVDSYLGEMADVGLIVRYEARGDSYILFPGFSSNQIGLRKDKEPDSGYPPPPDDVLVDFIRQHYDVLPEEFRKEYGEVTPEYKENSKLIEYEVKEELEENSNGEEESENPPDGGMYRPDPVSQVLEYYKAKKGNIAPNEAAALSELAAVFRVMDINAAIDHMMQSTPRPNTGYLKKVLAGWFSEKKIRKVY